MCEYCLRSGYHRPGCPNEPAPKVVTTCFNCGEDIYEGDECYDLPNGKWCTKCIEDSRITAEVD